MNPAQLADILETYGLAESTSLADAIAAAIASDLGSTTLTIIDYPHHEIHAGNHYKVGYQDITMDTDDVIQMAIITPDTTTQIHFTLTAQSTGVAVVQFYEGATLTNPGTPVANTNRYRDSTNTSTVTTTHSPVASSDGTKLSEKWIGGTGFRTDIGGETRGASEFILKRNTTYLIRLTAGADAMKGAIGADWYEHTPGD